MPLIRVNEADDLNLRLVHIAITAAAYDAICSTMPEDAPLCPVHRQGEATVSTV